jgi:hypothetical protein
MKVLSLTTIMIMSALTFLGWLVVVLENMDTIFAQIPVYPIDTYYNCVYPYSVYPYAVYPYVGYNDCSTPYKVYSYPPTTYSSTPTINYYP